MFCRTGVFSDAFSKVCFVLASENPKAHRNFFFFFFFFSFRYRWFCFSFKVQFKKKQPVKPIN